MKLQLFYIAVACFHLLWMLQGECFCLTLPDLQICPSFCSALMSVLWL